MPKFRSLRLDLPTLEALVASSDKQRFSLKRDADGTDLIRATQGHSIAISSEALQLVPLVPGTSDLPDHIVHGTFYGAWEAILASGGLKRMGRNHVHLAPQAAFGSGKVISGMRKDAEVLVVVNTKRASDMGIKFWRSENSVVLTEGNASGMVPLDCIDKAEDLAHGLGVLWEDGKVVQQLPPKLRGRALPRGKEHVGRREKLQAERDKMQAEKEKGQGKGPGQGKNDEATDNTAQTIAKSADAAEEKTDVPPRSEDGETEATHVEKGVERIAKDIAATVV